MKQTKRKLQREAAGSNKKIWIADEDMVRKHAAICNALHLVQPRWSHCAAGALLAWSDDGSLAIARHNKQPKLGWIAIRISQDGEQVPLEECHHATRSSVPVARTYGTSMTTIATMSVKDRADATG